jgi:ribosomal protein S18 acetylase RimI-like enzyme
VIVRPARPEDAASIGAVHVASWRSTYAGILPDHYLARLSVVRQAHGYERMMRARLGVFVAVAERRIVGFTTATRVAATPLGDGEIQTLYVLDDFRERGFGRALLQAAGEYLAGLECTCAFAWVLRDNPAVFFYERVGGKRAGSGTTHVAGTAIPQTAYTWNPIGKLLEKAQGVGEA